MSFTARDIEGATLEGYSEQQMSAMRIPGSERECRGYNNGIDCQSSVKLRFNREKLAATIFHRNNHDTGLIKAWEMLSPHSRETFYISADAVIAADKEIVEVEK